MNNDLIDATRKAAADAGIAYVKWEDFLAVIDPLRLHAEDMYDHSLRVGLYAHSLAANEALDESFALFGGCGHDIGKCSVSTDVLHAQNFGVWEKEAVKVHPAAGFELLAERYLYSSFIAGLHHQFQDDPYGIDLDAVSPYRLTDEAKASILQMGSLVATADFYDAYTTRSGYKSNDETRHAMARFETSRVEALVNASWDWLWA